MQSKIYISKLDCEGILQLMNNGFNFIQALKLIKNESNEKVINEINRKLSKGENIVNVFYDYCQEEYKDYFISFISFLPFYNSLSLTISIYNESKMQKQRYVKNLIYPVIVFISTILGIYFFVLVCMPILVSLMKEFNSNLNMISNLQNISLIFINFLFIVLLIVLLVTLYFLKKENHIKGYIFLSKIRILNIFRIMVSNDFARFYQQCTLIGCSTKSSIDILKCFTNKPLIKFLANIIDDSLSKGNSIETAFKSKYIDKSLYSFLNIAMYSSSINEMLEGYIKLNEIKLNTFFKRITYIIQIFVYLSISLILIFVYQILMMPLSIISNL